MKLFSSGKLKISGNLMASQKLDFLTKIDKAAVAAAMADRKPAPPPPPPRRRRRSPAKAAEGARLFKALAARLAATPSRRGDRGKVQFTVTGLDRAWVVDGANVTEGRRRRRAHPSC